MVGLPRQGWWRGEATLQAAIGTCQCQWGEGGLCIGSTGWAWRPGQESEHAGTFLEEYRPKLYMHASKKLGSGRTSLKIPPPWHLLGVGQASCHKPCQPIGYKSQPLRSTHCLVQAAPGDTYARHASRLHHYLVTKG